MRRFLWSVLIVLAVRTASAAVADITVDVGKNTVTPDKPIARVTEDGFLLVQILKDGNRPEEDKTRLVFSQKVLEYGARTGGMTAIQSRTLNNQEDAFSLPGTVHHLRLLPCQTKHLEVLQWIDANGVARVMTKKDCPLIVSNGFGSVTIVANDDSVPLVAEMKTDTALLRTPVSIRTVRPNYGLTFSTGPAFFAGDRLRDEKYRFDPIANNNTSKTIVNAGTGEAGYELGIYATYLFQRYVYLPSVPLGVTFGFSAKIPVEELTVAAGLSYQLKPFPVTDSAFITAGIAYRAHDRLLPKYRDASARIVPLALTEDQVVGKEHDVGLFIALHFAFAGGGRDSFVKVVSGGQ